MADLYLGKTKENTSFVLNEFDRFNHMLIVGPNGCGKTSKIIKPGVWQDLIDIKKRRLEYEIKIKEIKYKYKYSIRRINETQLPKEEKDIKIAAELEKCNEEISKINKYDYIRGLTLVEPKGDLAEEIAELCEELDVPYIYLDPLDPNTSKFNIMEGDPDTIAEANRTVLRNTFGKQEQFFALIQETTARNVILLLKKLMGDNLDLLDVSRALRSQDTLKNYVDQYEKKYGTDDLVAYYRSEIFGTLQDKFYQFAMGLRQQLEDLGQNKYLKNILLGKSSINLDKHLAEGGILIVNTAMGELGNLGDTFGKFVIMHIQNAVFRRPGTEFTRPYHHLWIDEVPRYVNPDLERLLAIGRGFRCSVSMALQTPQQLVLEEKSVLKDIILTNCRNQVVFGGLSKDDAEYFEKALGTDTKQQKQFTYKYNKIAPIRLLPNTYRTTKTEENRFRYTDIMELPISRECADVIIKYVKYGELQKPVKVSAPLRQYKKPEELRKMEIKATEEYWENWLKKKEPKKKESKPFTSLSSENEPKTKGKTLFAAFLGKMLRNRKMAVKTTTITEIKEPPSYKFEDEENADNDLNKEGVVTEKKQINSPPALKETAQSVESETAKLPEKLSIIHMEQENPTTNRTPWETAETEHKSVEQKNTEADSISKEQTTIKEPTSGKKDDSTWWG